MTQKTKRKKPWNKGKIVGGKTALLPDEVQAIRVVLAQKGWPARDALLFALGVDSSLRGADLVRLRVSDVMLAGEPRERVTIEPSKTKASSGARVTFKLQADTAELLRRFVSAENLLTTDYLFASSLALAPGQMRTPLTERSYALRVKKWVAAIGLPPEAYGTHSVRKVLSANLYKRTGNLRACQVILGHQSITTTQRYLGIEEDEALSLVEQFAV